MVLVGVKLPMGCENARDTADAVALRVFSLARARDIGNVTKVMEALPQGALTKRLIRYPSPYGRCCAGWHRPPVFSLRMGGCAYRLRLADQRPAIGDRFDGTYDMALTKRDIQSRISGDEPKCRQFNAKLSRCSRPLPSRRLRPVVTPCPNRRFWAAVPERSPALWLAEASSLGPLSVLRAMSFIVRLTQAAVTKKNSSRAPGLLPVPCDAETRTIGA